MAGSSEDPCRTPRRLADLYGGGGGPEEGEIVPGYHSDADTAGYYNSNRDCSSDSDETISDSAPARYRGAASTSTSRAAAGYGGARTFSAADANTSPSAAAAHVCPFCGKGFRNHKAVCGHMKVHREQGVGKASKGIKRGVPAVGGWGGTAKRGCCAGSRARASSPIPEPGDQSMAVMVVAEAKIVLNPMPLAFATPNNLPPVVPAATAMPDPSPVPVAAVMASDSVESSSGGDATETVAARRASPPKEDVVDLHAAPPPPPPPAGEQAPPVHQQRVAPPPPPRGRQDPNGYTCGKCNKWFPTHQGLGGHTVGHKNRELAAAALQGGAAPPSRDARAGRTHACKVCGAEFPGGIQLGGHMRKHWKGAPFNKKPRRLVQPLPPPGLTLAHAGSPAPRPAVAGRVLLFGIDIGAGVKTPAAQGGSSAPEASASVGGDK